MSEARTATPPWNWPAVIMFIVTTVPVVTVLPWYAWNYGFDAFEWITFVLLWGASGMGITAGYHRLWAHRSYEASKPLQIVLMLFGAMGFILGPILAALFVTAWEMFGTAFRRELAEPVAPAQ